VLCCAALRADIRSKLLPVLLEWDMQQQAAEGEHDEDGSGKVGGWEGGWERQWQLPCACIHCRLEVFSD
jgi:hypothetical protein